MISYAIENIFMLNNGFNGNNTLLLDEHITNSSIQVQFLTTDPSNIRTKAILPFNPEFDTITYKNYFETYKINLLEIRRTIYQDNLENFVIKYKNKILS
ncbi:12253_t:CDS:2 [Gigaspora rosea]|nr:12253_t:CDS:2 [Gigaspora rosea]